MCEFDLSNRCELWTEKERTARIHHKCNSCGGRIAPKEKYISHFSKFCGEICCEKMCVVCEGLRAEFAAEHGGVLFPPSCWFGEVLECAAEDPSSNERWAAIIKEMKNKKGGHGESKLS